MFKEQTTLRLLTPSKSHTKHPTTITMSTQTKRTEVRQAPVIDLVMVKIEFPAESIVSKIIRDLDYGRFPNRNHASTFYGAVEVMEVDNGKDGTPVEEGWSYIKFVVSCEYKWYDKNKVNVSSGVYHDTLRTLCSYSTRDTCNYERLTEGDFSRWFTKETSKWTIKVQEPPCYGCVSS